MIASIAFSVSFADLSHLNRAYRNPWAHEF
jgi:transcriptional regulator GlxA family with amidase domain